MSALRQIRRGRLIVTALALAWLPNVTLRCMPGPESAHAGCDVLAHRSEAAEHEVDTEHHEHPGHHHEGPASTCCELTGKSNVTLPVTFTADPPLLASFPVSLPDTVTPKTEALDAWGSLSRAHAPPAYLRNSALLI